MLKKMFINNWVS